LEEYAMVQIMEPKKPLNNILTYEDMLDKLNKLYTEQEELITKLKTLEDDIEFIQTMIMYKFNKENPLSWLKND